METLEFQNWKITALLQTFSAHPVGKSLKLKSKDGRIGRKISDGAYDTMISRITSMTNPDLLVMHYSSLQVVDLTVVPKFFFTPTVIEKRKPLSPTARRAGWVGCNILYGDIPEQGRIPIIENQNFRSKDRIVQDYARIKHLQTGSIEKRGWLFDVLNCVNCTPDERFLSEGCLCVCRQTEDSASRQSKH